jgi:PEP-CTERM motif
MKKTLLVLCMSAGLVAQSALATITFSTNQNIYNAAPGGSVTLTLSVASTGATPTNVDGFDTIFEGATSQNSVPDISSDFTISASSASQSGWVSNSATYPATFSTTFSDHTGFTQNQKDAGYFDFNTPAGAQGLPGTVALASYTFSIAPGTPTGNYVFDTTAGSYTNSAGGASTRFSRISNSDGVATRIDNPAVFTITVSTIPEPATWSLFGLGSLGSLGLTMLRARRKG